MVLYHGLVYKVYVKAIHVCTFTCIVVVQVIKPMTIEFHQLLGHGFSHGAHGPSWSGPDPRMQSYGRM